MLAWQQMAGGRGTRRVRRTTRKALHGSRRRLGCWACVGRPRAIQSTAPMHPCSRGPAACIQPTGVGLLGSSTRVDWCCHLWAIHVCMQAHMLFRRGAWAQAAVQGRPQPGEGEALCPARPCQGFQGFGRPQPHKTARSLALGLPPPPPSPHGMPDGLPVQLAAVPHTPAPCP